MKSIFILLFLLSFNSFANDLCNKSVKFNGNCEAFLTVYEYDAKAGKCHKVEGSGCSSDNGFVSEKECLEVCQGTKSLFERITDKTQEKLAK